MKNFKKLVIITALSFTIQQYVMAYDKSADDSQPRHQGFGRIGTAVENTLTLHPLNGVNALATGNQSDTTFGYHKDDNGRIKANRARTEHNQNKTGNLSYRERRQIEADRKEQRRLDERAAKRERHEERKEREEADRQTTGHLFWKRDKTSN